VSLLRRRDEGSCLHLDFATAKAIRTNLGLPAQEPETLAHAPPEVFELVAESA